MIPRHRERVKKLALRYLTHSGRTCVVSSPATTDDGAGGQLEGPATLSAALPCFIKADIRRPYEVPVGGGVQVNNLVEIHLPYGTLVDPEDIIIATSSEDPVSRRFEVVVAQPDDESAVMTVQTLELD